MPLASSSPRAFGRRPQGTKVPRKIVPLFPPVRFNYFALSRCLTEGYIAGAKFGLKGSTENQMRKL